MAARGKASALAAHHRGRRAGASQSSLSDASRTTSARLAELEERMARTEQMVSELMWMPPACGSVAPKADAETVSGTVSIPQENEVVVALRADVETASGTMSIPQENEAIVVVTAKARQRRQDEPLAAVPAGGDRNGVVVALAEDGGEVEEEDEECVLIDGLKQVCYVCGSTWDAVVFVGYPQLCLTESILLLLLFALTIFAQMVFLGITYFVFAQPLFSPELLELLDAWRISFGHHIKFYDANTFTSLTQRVCAPNEYVAEMSSGTSSLVKQLNQYMGEGESWSSVFNGPSLVKVALMLWGLTVIAELTRIWDLFRAMRALPRTKNTLLLRLAGEGSSALQIVGMGRGRRIWVYSLLVLRTGSAIFLWVLGSQFLCYYSISPADIVLNAVALEIVLTVDEAMFILVPSRVKGLMDRLEPLPSPPGRCQFRLADMRPCLFFILLITAIIAFQFLVLNGVADYIAAANSTLCGGVQDFVYSTDAFHVVFVSPSNPYNYSKEAVAKYGHTQAINETIYPETIPLWTAGNYSTHLSMTVHFFVAPLEQVRMRMNWDVEQSATGVQALAGTVCEDSIGALPEFTRFWNESLDALAYLPVTVNYVQTCNDVQPLCMYFPMARASCPETCGCTSPLSPMFVSSPRYGCPEACQVSEQHAARLAEIPCSERSPAELSVDPLWAAWAEQFATEAGLVIAAAQDFNPCTDCAALFRTMGCDFIPFWVEVIKAKWFVTVNPCVGNYMQEYLQARPLAPYCPVTCGCSGTSKTAAELRDMSCPGTCAVVS